MSGATRTRLYRKGVLELEDFPVADISEHLEEDDTVVWADFCGPSKEQLDELASELHLHELAVEDALSPHQRPKVDYYDTHLFLSCHAVRVDSSRGGLDATEIDAFAGARWLVTVRSDDGFDMDLVERRWDVSARLATHGVSFLLYGLLDVVVDVCFDAVEAFDEFYDTISEAIFSGTPMNPAEQRRWFDMRRALVRFHRIVVPTREVVSSLMRRDSFAVAAELEPYYQDVYDHTLRAGEATDSLRDLVSTIVETNLSLQDYRQNQIVKKVSSWAAIIAVPAFLTGYFGMNVPYPGAGETSGVIGSSVLIVLLSTGLYWVFRRKDWL
jgi:magnesium transporter